MTNMEGIVEEKVNTDLKLESVKAIDFDEEEEEFSFMFGEANMSPIAAEDAFMNGQIKPIYPLFNTDLLLSDNHLSMIPQVKKVFVETTEENIDEITGPYCEWSNRKAVESTSEIGKKSNSTGFSKIWRFRDLMGRSNSDGRDAFVYVKEEETTGRRVINSNTVNSENVKKSKTVSLSAHEVYLKSKAKEDERRKSSYLPYRHVGFFTNVNGGGLTKNIHPY